MGQLNSIFMSRLHVGYLTDVDALARLSWQLSRRKQTSCFRAGFLRSLLRPLTKSWKNLWAHLICPWGCAVPSNQNILMAPTQMKPEHYDKQCALLDPLNVGQSCRRPDKVNLLLTEGIFPQLIRARLENPQLLSGELHPPLILVMDKQALYMPALPSSGPFAQLFEVVHQDRAVPQTMAPLIPPQ